MRHPCPCWRATPSGLFGFLLAAALLWALGIDAARAEATPEPWLAGPFQASAAEIYHEAVARSEGVDAGAVMLYQGVEYSFAADGRLEIERHWIYRVLDGAALSDWAVSQMRWSPWHQHRPEIKARVIREGGDEQWVDPSQFEEQAAPESSDGLRGERRILSGRLPGVETGAVVEEAIVLREKRPSFPWGTAHRHYTALFIPTVRGRLVLDASTRLALRYGARKMPGLEPSSTEIADGRVRVTFDFFDLPAVDPVEDGLPGHLPRYPHIAFSTGRSWNWVATGLGQLFEKVVTETRLDALAEDLPSPSDPLQVRLDKILAEVRKRIEYNGLEINASPLDPDPDRVLREGSGDAFDIALTLVAAFRRVGLESTTALVNSGFGTDVEPRLPGFGLFNHALVRVTPGPGLDPVWIDPIAPYSRPGELPLAAQGRFALIIGPDTEKPILTPATDPEDNLARETRKVYFSDYGPGRIVERCEYFGSAERSQRRITAGLEDEARRRGYRAYAHAFHQAAELGALRESEATDLSGPFVLELEAVGSNRVRTELEQAVLEIPVRELARRVPAVLLEEGEGPRREEYVFPEPFVTEWRYEVLPPPGFVPADLPADLEMHLGPAVYRRSFRREGERVIGELRFDVGQRLLAPGQFEELRRSLRDFLSRPALEVRFDSLAGRDFADGDLVGAFSKLQEAVDREPERPSRHVRFSQALLRIGMVQEAEHQARQAVSLAPSWGTAYWALARALEHDELGRRFAPRAPLPRAAEALEQAVRLAQYDPVIRAEYPRLLLRSADGRPGPGAEIESARKAFEKWRADFDRDDLDAELAELYRSQRMWPELARLLEETEPGSALHRAARVMVESADDASVEPADGADREAVARELFLGREYEHAARLLSSGGAPPAEWAWLAGVRRVEDMEQHPEDPRTPVQRLVVALRSAHPLRDDLAAALHPRLLTQLDPADLQALRRRFDASVPAAGRAGDPSPEVWADLVLAGLRPELAGAPHLGYRVELGGIRGGSAADAVFFVTPSSGGLWVAAMGSSPSHLGEEALERLEQGDLPGARRWLDWARQILPADGAETGALDPLDRDPLDLEPLRYLWRVDKDFEPSVDFMRVAAAALAAPSDRSGVSLSMLQGATWDGMEAGLEEKARGELDAGRAALALDVARLHAFSSGGAFLDLEALAGSLGDRYPDSSIAYQRQVEALTALGEWQTFVSRTEARLRRRPNDVDAHRALAHWALRTPDAAAAEKHFSAVGAQGKLSPGDVATWIFAQASGESLDDEAALARLEQTADEGRDDAIWLRARALLLARRGRAVEARESLVSAIEVQGTEALTVEDGFLLGRMAEGVGLSRLAADLYSRLLSNGDLQVRSPLVYVLAERRLRRLRSGG